MTRFEQILDELISLVNQNYTNELMGMDSALDYEKQVQLRKDLIDFCKASGRIWDNTDRVQAYGVEFYIDKKTIEDMFKEVE